MQKSLIPWTVLTAVAAASAPAFAQNPAAAWPTKPVTVVIANVPGGDTDVETRMYTDKLTKVFGKPFIFEFKPGGGGSIGSTYVSKAAPDGHTFLIATTSFTVTPVLNEVSYDITKDFAAVTMVSRGYIVLFANPSFPVSNLKEYIAYARANPGKITWATSGVGAMNHLSGELFHSEIKGPATFVHYKGGGQAALDLLAGRVNVAPGSLGGMVGHLKSGKLKPIVTLSLSRVPQLPDLPTAHEQGVKDFEQPNYVGWVTSAGTHPAIVEKMSAELRKLTKDPEIKERIESEGSVMVGNTPAEFQKYILSQFDRWSKVVKERNIKVN